MLFLFVCLFFGYFCNSYPAPAHLSHISGISTEQSPSVYSLFILYVQCSGSTRRRWGLNITSWSRFPPDAFLLMPDPPPLPPQQGHFHSATLSEKQVLNCIFRTCKARKGTLFISVFIFTFCIHLYSVSFTWVCE